MKKHLGCILLVLLLGGCTQAAPAPLHSQYTTLEALLGDVNAAHKSVQKLEINFEEWMPPYTGKSVLHEKLQCAAPPQPEELLTMAQVEEDCSLFFACLRGKYGAYHFFGGDEAFEAAKARLLQACATEESISVAAFQAHLMRALAFIQDSHFTINGNELHNSKKGYSYPEGACLRTAQGYLHIASGKRLEGISGIASIEEVMCLSISEEGGLVYMPVILAQNAPGSITLALEGGCSITCVPAPQQASQARTKRFRCRSEQGIPIISGGNMGFDHAKQDQTGKTFLGYAQRFAGEPVLMIDLRANPGGNGILPLKWYERYAGARVPTNFLALVYMDEADLQGQSPENPYYTPFEELQEYGGWQTIAPHYMRANWQPDAFVPHEGLLILLVGNGTASAAEYFTDMAFNMENTLIIGQNTAGALRSTGAFRGALPNSGIHVQYGNQVFLFPEGHFEEYRGFMPDIWVAGDAKKAELKLLGWMRG